MMAGRSVVRDDATAAVPSSQWRPLDAEEPDELPRGLGIFSRRKSGLTNLQRGTVNTSHHHTDSRYQKPRSARLDAPHPPGFVRAYSEYVSQGNSSQGNSHHSPPPPFSPRRLSPGRARTLALTNGALAPLSRPPPRLPRRHLHRPFRCGNERPPSTHSPFPTATSYSQILRARARALS